MFDIQFEKFNYSHDLAEQRKLFMECFPETIGTPVTTSKHYEWKFKSFPNCIKEKSYEYVVKLDNEIIGYYGAIPYEYYIKGEKKTVAMVCDVMTGVKARGKGVFTKLGKYSIEQFRKEGISFSTGYPIRPEVIPGHRKVGWTFPFQVPMYGKFLKLNSFLHARRKSFLIPFANIVLKAYNGFFNLTIKSHYHIDIEKYSSLQLDEIIGLNEFIKEWNQETPISLNKSINFLKWRLGAPGKKYEIIILRDNRNKKIVGYSIAREIQKEGVPCLGILDFCLLKNTTKFSNLLLQEIESTAKAFSCELILMMMLKHKANDYKITRYGFLKTPFPFSFILKQYDDSLSTSFLNDEKNWALMWIDSDDL